MTKNFYIFERELVIDLLIFLNNQIITKSGNIIKIERKM